MALSVTTPFVGIIGNRKLVVASATFDASYPAGGEAFIPATVGLIEFDYVSIQPVSGYVIEYIASTGKLKVYAGDAAEAAHTHTSAAHTHTGAAHVHTTTVDNADTGSTASGEGSSTAPGAGSSSGSVAQSAADENTTANLSTLVVNVFCVGT